MSEVIESHIVPEGVEKIRLSDYAPRIFTSIPSKKGIKKAIKRGEVWVNGKAAETGRWVESGQKIELVESDVIFSKVYRLSMEVVYEDDSLALINKPGGVPVSGNQFRTVQNALPFNLEPSHTKDALKRFLPVHRLDSPTCGLLLIAKTRMARIQLGQQFENREVRKRYRAVVIGKSPESGVIDQPIEAKKAITEFRLVKQTRSQKYEWLSMMDVCPLTGRTHQIRVHLADSGFPVLGDKLYGEERLILKGKGLFLCATELTFRHPTTQAPFNLKIKAPNKFASLLDREKRRWENNHHI